MTDHCQLLDGPIPERSGGVIKKAEVKHRSRGLLQVVADDLVEFG